MGDFKRDIKSWQETADMDFKAAGLLAKAGMTPLAIYHYQQASEKYLKAIVIGAGIGIEKTHSINKLIHKLSRAGITISLDPHEGFMFESVNERARYPTDGDSPGELYSTGADLFKQAALTIKQEAEKVLEEFYNPNSDDSLKY